MSLEVPLEGGRVTAGVVRVGETVRRPPKPSSPFVRALLALLSARGFDVAPRRLGTDERGRDVFSFLPGHVPSELDAAHSDDVLAAAARLIRRLHDATAGSSLAAGAEVVCHNDISPCNCVFRGGVPVAIIDFDAAAPGSRLDDLGYALFLWLNIGTDGPPPGEQVRRMRLFCGAYGIAADAEVLDAVTAAVERTIRRLNQEGRKEALEWWQEQRDWLGEHRPELEALPTAYPRDQRGNAAP